LVGAVVVAAGTPALPIPCVPRAWVGFTGAVAVAPAVVLSTVPGVVVPWRALLTAFVAVAAGEGVAARPAPRAWYP
jgi:hypothetical protein